MWDVGGRSLHYDEVLHAWYAWLYAGGSPYHHTPLTHGPFLFHMAAATYKLLGSSDVTVRLIPALFGTVLVAVPYFLRKELGRPAALVAGVMLAASPTILYFGRFIRNDIYMAVWVLALVAVIWRYMERPRSSMMVAWAALWALAFTTKESSFMAAAILGLLLLILAWRDLPRTGNFRQRLANLPPAGALLLVLITLTLPLWGPALGLVQDWIGVILVTPDPNELNGDAREAAVAFAAQGAPLRFWLIIGSVMGAAAMAAGFALVRTRQVWRPMAPGLATIAVVFGVILLGFDRIVSFNRGEGFFLPLFDNLRTWASTQPAETGAPLGAGVGLAVGVTLALTTLAVVIGLMWNRRLWPLLALTFAAIWLPLFTSFGTNRSGFFTGLWGSLGYWVAQQPVERAGQPWFYYLLTTANYEFLAFVPALIAGPYLLWKGNRFDRFIVAFAFLTFAAFTYAGEKMPWLTVGVTVPVILVTARGLGLIIESRPWERMGLTRALAAVVWGAALLATLTLVAMEVAASDEYLSAPRFIIGLAGMLVAIAALTFMGWRHGVRSSLGLAGLGTIVLLFGLTLVVAGRASYSYSGYERPMELMVYSQTGQETSYAAQMLDQLAVDTGKGKDGLRVLVGESDNFAWQWRWYLRDYDEVQIRFLKDEPLTVPSDVDVVMLSKSVEGHNREGLEGFTKVSDLYHLWWFPNTVYKEATPRSVFKAAFDRDGWNGALNYFFLRELQSSMYKAEGSVYVADQYAALVQTR
jgi:predicted membrane-bound mannosyltransferase